MIRKRARHRIFSLTLNIFHRHTDRLKMANVAQMVNVLQAIILTDKEKMVLTPTYHAPFASKATGGKLVFELPARSVAVVAVG